MMFRNNGKRQVVARHTLFCAVMVALSVDAQLRIRLSVRHGSLHADLKYMLPLSVR